MHRLVGSYVHCNREHSIHYGFLGQFRNVVSRIDYRSRGAVIMIGGSITNYLARLGDELKMSMSPHDCVPSVGRKLLEPQSSARVVETS